METIYFYDVRWGKMKCEEWGANKEIWLFYKHPDGQWVSLRKTTEADNEALAFLMGG